MSILVFVVYTVAVAAAGGFVESKFGSKVVTAVEADVAKLKEDVASLKSDAAAVKKAV